MAGNGVDCKWLWSVCQVSQRECSEQLDLVEDLRLTHDDTVTLRGFVALTLAQLLTPDKMLHRLLTQRERHVLKLDSFGHVSHGELVNHLFVDILSIAPIRADVNGR